MLVQTQYYLQTERAPSNRAMCRGCKQKITKETLRIAYVIDIDNQQYHSERWHHLECLEKLPKQVKDVEVQDIVGFDALQLGDKRKIIQLLDNLKNMPAINKAKKKAKFLKKIFEAQEVQSQNESSHEYQAEAEDGDEDLQAGRPEGYTPVEWKRYLKFMAELQSSSVANLKSLLKLNDLKLTGTKQELIERAADGKALGAIPKCNKCGGGRPRFDVQTAKYKCPGYMEDAKFVRCFAQYEKSELQRTEWKEL